MFNFLKKTPKGETLSLKITDMHCTSCAMTIDYQLEECDGVVNASTNYAKSQATIIYDSTKISIEEILSVIKKAGYTASITNVQSKSNIKDV